MVMNLLSLAKFVFSQFKPLNWQNGLSIYRAGGVLNFKSYGELVSAKIHAGVGELYEVRIKLHKGGKFFQWMECTCNSNRRHGDKCPHLAATFIYLDQDKYDFLSEIQIAGKTPNLFSLSKLNNKQNQNPYTNSNQKDASFEKLAKLNKKIDQSKKEFKIESFFDKQDLKLLRISEDNERPWIQAHVLTLQNKEISYRFALDDAIKLLFNQDYSIKSSKKLQNLISKDIEALRSFHVTLDEQKNIKVDKIVILKNQKNSKDQVLYCSKILPQFIGKIGLYSEKYGYIQYSDRLETNSAYTWFSYPKSITLKDDEAAQLIENNFDILKKICHVEMASSLQKLQIKSSIKLDEISVQKEKNGEYKLVSKIADLEGQKITNSLISIINARKEGRKYIKTKKGFLKISEGVDWLKDKIDEKGNISLFKAELIKFHETFAKNSQIKKGRKIIDRIREGLGSRDNLDLPSLDSTKLSLRPYQLDGLKWLWWLYSNELGGLLADEMGLGKTHQAMGLISLIQDKKKTSKALVVAPTSVLDHWEDKMQKFTPNISLFTFYGSSRKNEIPKITQKGHYNTIITSYGILLRDIELLKEINWDLVILDEAHLVKNQLTRTYKAACKLNSTMRLCLTGTPLENDLIELKNLFDFIVPGYLGTNVEFKKRYLDQSATMNDNPLLEAELNRLLHPFKLRRKKTDVIKDLPDKVEDIKYCHLNQNQKNIYNQAVNLRAKSIVEGLKNNDSSIPYIHIFSLISLLKQICNDPALIDPSYEGVSSGKLELFDELIQESLESDFKVVVFSQYAKMVKRLSNRLSEQNISHVTLTGQSTNRGKIVRKFQEDDSIKVFIGSLLAGGTGIDLTKANVVIHFDRWWNSAKENQATDRIHRIGQSKNVQVYKLVTKDTLEEKIDKIISSKKDIFEKFVDSTEDAFKNFSRADLLKLFSPIQDDNS